MTAISAVTQLNEHSLHSARWIRHFLESFWKMILSSLPVDKLDAGGNGRVFTEGLQLSREVRDGDGDGAGLQPRACAPSNKDDGSFRKPGAWGDVGPGGGGAAQSYPLNTSAWKIWSVICFYLFLCGALSHSQHLEFQTGYLWSIQEAYRQDLSLPEGFVPMGQRSQCSLFHSPFVHSQNKPR